MQTSPITLDQLSNSVIAVPPLARDSNRMVVVDENRKIANYLVAGGVSIVLYGGNANFYHIKPSEYASTLETIVEISENSVAPIPSVGPAFGLMMDQAEILSRFDFPTAMVLPQNAVMTESGLMRGFAEFVNVLGRPAVLYIKEEGYISPAGAAKLVADGLVSFIKYAIVREDPATDDFLSELLERVPAKYIVSGIGEQPATIHLRDFGLNSFTSGCVCVAPAMSMQILNHLKAGEIEQAEQIREKFVPLEDCRNSIHPIRVLHEAVELAGIAVTGPQIPYLDGLAEVQKGEIQRAAMDLMKSEKSNS